MSIDPNAEILDALPYYDDDLEKYPHLRLKVEKELAKERIQTTELHPRVPPPVDSFADNPLLKAELERVAANKPPEPLDTARYSLPEPTNVPGTDEEWKAALDNAKAQLEHQRIRQANLALLQSYGSNAYRVQNYLLENTVKQAEKAVEELREETVGVNRERKNAQEQLGRTLTGLETRWTELISSVLQIELANGALEAEIGRLQARAEELSSIT